MVLRRKTITRIVWILSLVSLFTDIASEMLYPVMPIFLESIGFSVLLIGILEGIAEATAGLSKGYFGKMSDNLEKRLPFVRWGYSLSAVSKPMLALWAFPLWIFLARTLDRLGKGLRTGARDAMLSEQASPQTKGTVFGFHRSMDTVGAVIGPLVAIAFLYFNPQTYRPLFLLAFVPGIIAVSFTLLLKEPERVKQHLPVKTSLFDFIRYWKTSPINYRRLTKGILLFTLFNSSDVFLILRLKEIGISDTVTIGVYVFYNIVFALFSYPLGIIADKIGLKKIFLSGLLLFVVVYAGMAVNKGFYGVLFLFFLYGIYAAATDGVSKAWVSNLVKKSDTATAIGTLTGFQSICTMIASSFAGLLWYTVGSLATFMLTSFMTLVAIIYILFLKLKD
ncbi:MFS transporter [Chitinophaga silvatica]|uniref:MFS transporter n=1 Tax=Chitinophaga silvatica TaxID=2282649 RepID=A0A3E1YH27_9BACT|nr:MFS transporter [Chitinophaga silvatica]RFS26701.1 MFS transporter [Chitinophaga silvatica]